MTQAHRPFRPRWHPRALIACLLLAAPSGATAQTLTQSLTTNVASSAAAPPPTAESPTPVAAQSWGWVLRPGTEAQPHLLLAANGAARTVTVVEWSNDGQLRFAGSSPDPEANAVLDLTGRLLAGASQPEAGAAQARLWGAWRQMGSLPSQNPTLTTEGRRSWGLPLAPLTAAFAGERQRARAIDLTGAGAIVVAFPYPGTLAQFDVAYNGDAHPDLRNVLAYMTMPDAPVPIAGLPGLRKAWVDAKGLGVMGTYQAEDGRPWAFWTLAP